MLQIKTLPNKMNVSTIDTIKELYDKATEQKIFMSNSDAILKYYKFTSPKYAKNKYYIIIEKIYIVVTVGKSYIVEFYKTDKQGNVTHYYFNDSSTLIYIILEDLPKFIKNSKK